MSRWGNPKKRRAVRELAIADAVASKLVGSGQMLRVGDRVEHLRNRDLDDGTIVEISDYGRIAHVRWSSGTTNYMSIADLAPWIPF